MKFNDSKYVCVNIKDLGVFAKKVGIEAANRVIFELNKKKELEEKKHNPVKIAKRMLEGYRRLKNTIKEDIQDSKVEAIGYYWKYLEELIGKPENKIITERVVYDKEKKLQYNRYKLNRIEHALSLYRKECEASGKEEVKRRYRIIDYIYVNKNRLNVNEIAIKEGISPKTVYKDIDIACNVLAVYLSLM